MAKRTNPEIKRQVLSHIEALYDKYGAKFFDALDDSDSKKLNMDFTATINLAESAPVITTCISFKDKCKEAGMDVTKTFSADITDVLEDPQQPELEGTKGKSRKEQAAGGDN
jgi:hypothetical protein